MKIVGVIAVVVLVVGAVLAGGYAFKWFTIPFVGALEQREITNRGQYRIQAYEQFYRWQEELASVDTKLAGYPVPLQNSRQSTECQGLLARRADIVSEYNAASRAVLTQGQWQASDLPITLPHTNPRSCQ